MISYAEALALVREAGERRLVGAEHVPFSAAPGRVAAADVRTPEPLPRFDNSGMDGFAVRSGDVVHVSAGQPLTLTVGASFAAGDAAIPAGPHCAVEVMTGAPLPPGFDAVVRVEDVTIHRDGAGEVVAVTLREPVSSGDDVRFRGEDYRVDDRIAASGEVLRAEHVMALAAVGCTEVEVRRRPRVTIVATGKELVPPGTKALAPGAIRNSTSSYLAAALPSFGAEVVSLVATGDDPSALRAALFAAREAGVDLVLTTGAASFHGKHDHVAEVLQEVGARMLFHGVGLRPGKPTLVAELSQGPMVVGLPGNPVASAVGARFIAVPMLRAMLGMTAEVPLRARLSSSTRKPEGLLCAYKAWVSVGPGGASVEVLGGQSPAIVSSLVAANAWAVLPERGCELAAGSEVDVYPFTEPGFGPVGGIASC